ncbi:MAG: hypothetical protein C5S48_04185 [Candidatus Methanogaster sp.]|nr:MAG: hypothetical protein C5S48_04185 [ANME-2 cluster archaeon]
MLDDICSGLGKRKGADKNAINDSTRIGNLNNLKYFFWHDITISSYLSYEPEPLITSSPSISLNLP